MLHLDIECNSDDSLLRYLATNCGERVTSELQIRWASSLPYGDSPSSEIGRRLLERRLYRPLVILAGDNLQGKSPLFRAEREAEKIVEQLYGIIMFHEKTTDGTEVFAQRWDAIQNIEAEIEKALSGSDNNRGGVIAYCLKPKFGYKKALVLCRWTDDKVQPLQDLDKTLPAVEKQIEAMQENYKALWRLFLFVKPEYLVPHNGGADDEDEVLGRCNVAISRFLSWSHTYDVDDRHKGETPDRSLNCLNIKEAVGKTPQSCRDVRFGFSQDSLEFSNAHSNRLTLRIETSEKGKSRNLKDHARQEYGIVGAAFGHLQKVFVEERIRDEEEQCIQFLDMLMQPIHDEEAARHNVSLPERLRSSIRTWKLRPTE
jgi:hypothetical protein